jgi:hypothetical protein
VVFAPKESLLFEIELAKVSQARELRRNATRMYNPMTLAQLQDLAPIVPWVTYINNILTQKIIQVGGIVASSWQNFPASPTQKSAVFSEMLNYIRAIGCR